MPSGTTFFPTGHRLLKSTKELIQPTPIDIPRELNRHPLPPYTIEPGDVLLIQPADLDSPVRLPGDQPVLPDGTIQLGRYGLLQVAGMTIPEVEALVKSTVEAQTKDPDNPTIANNIALVDEAAKRKKGLN